MHLVFPIPKDKLLLPFSELKTLLTQYNRQGDIFDAAHQVTALSQNQISLPQNPSEYKNKYDEIEGMFVRRGITNGQDLAIELYEELWKLIQITPLPGVSNQDIIKYFKFELDDDTSIILTPNGNVNSWTLEWSFYIFQQKETINIITRDAGKIVVPDYIVKYIHTAAISFRSQLHEVCLALCSIVMEATLKDKLAPLGYTGEYSQKKIGKKQNPKYLGGLGTALDKARNVEKILTPGHFSLDLDDVIQPVRNNLVHVSKMAFSTPLPKFSSKNPNYTLGDFLEEPYKVFDMLQTVTKCCYQLYSIP